MSSSLSPLIDAFADLDVLVLGDAILDSYLEGTPGRLCREAPVPIVDLTGRRDAPGGAANTAVNARALGARVRFLSLIGDDAEGEILQRVLRERGIDAEDLLVGPARRTLAKHRVVAASQLLVRFDQGTKGVIPEEFEEELIGRLSELFPLCDAVIISDYGYGVLSPRVIAALADLQAETPRILVADSKDLIAYRHVGLTAVKPNYGEALQLLDAGEPQDGRARAEAIAARGACILERTGARIAAVTLDTEGALIFERDRPPYRTYARPTPHSRAAGAGDTFLAAMALGLAAGGDTPSAAELASAAAAVVVSKDGTAACSAGELRTLIEAGGKVIHDRAALAVRLDDYRKQGRRVVFTNGCFDILHRGHITYLNSAKALGDVLVVGVNSDDGIRRLKGPLRPINALEDRIQVLAALSCVDHIIAFDEDTPCDLIRVVRPDVFVKGGDYTRERLPEAPLVEALGGVVQILPFVADRSTTGIIERIRAAYGFDGPLSVPCGTPALALSSANGNGKGDLA
ncbi:MAG: D-glycero-beta-D-manno-heptose 1-phosphate adenylyltransferase [Isosphaeraceae bacterium]|nr:D-glycero-beta-D-manno-heptose 1-phosphate adenylyltransferase [Isosphaeraceae bacterium]